jgi:hypothetical protein
MALVFYLSKKNIRERVDMLSCGDRAQPHR